jgi:hypothetical protein
MISSLATAGLLAFVAVPALMFLGKGAPEGYARQQMAVESVSTEPDAKVAPVVMTNDKGDAIIWLVSSEAEPASQDGGSDAAKVNGGEL